MLTTWLPFVFKELIVVVLAWIYPGATVSVAFWSAGWRGSGHPQVESHWVSPSWIVVLLGLVALTLFGHTALALTVSYKDSSTGADKTVSVDVTKGKSKGVYGSTKGLQITN